MATLKTHKWASKRFKITKGKKVTFSKACNNHLLTNKGKTNKKSAYGKTLHTSYTKKIKALFPYN
jgi:ribosomal protein L35